MHLRGLQYVFASERISAGVKIKLLIDYWIVLYIRSRTSPKPDVRPGIARKFRLECACHMLPYCYGDLILQKLI